MEQILKDYDLSLEDLKTVRDLMTREMVNGLSKEKCMESSVKMLVSYVQHLPTGHEFGEFLALDLGGTNFRVLLINLKGSEAKMESKIYPLSDEIKSSDAVQLFDYIVACLADFLQTIEVHHTPMPLGFTFSFPVIQHGLASGTLVQWTKEIYCTGVVGEDVVKLLQEAIDRKQNVPVRCVALVNDTVGCLMSCAFEDTKTAAGVIIGTGTNASYVEKIRNISKFDAGENIISDDMIINMEWGGFGDNGCLDFLRTDSDRAIDERSVDKGKQIFEKMISGRYLGEIARLVIIKCAKQGLLFNGEDHLSKTLKTLDSFQTKYLSEIESDLEGSFEGTRRVLNEIGMNDVSDEDCLWVWKICRVVSDRSSSLVGAATAAVVNKMDRKELTVGTDGSLYRYHPHFAQNMLNFTRTLIRPDIKVDMKLSEDGSGKGAAVIAAVAEKLYF